MKKIKVSAKELKRLGITNPKTVVAIGQVATRVAKEQRYSKLQILEIISNIVAQPNSKHWNKTPLKPLVDIIREYAVAVGKPDYEQDEFSYIDLLPHPQRFKVYGDDCIEASAFAQMETAMSLPIAQQGALMPDAHEGYGLPIGGVLATSENVVIPYAVGVDIACRMCMSVFPVDADYLERKDLRLNQLLVVNSVFGVGAKNKNHLNTMVFDRSEWNATNFIRQHRDLAFSQLGTSGAGNHFVEWGTLMVTESCTELHLKKGEYLALLSHSGSRGFGSEVASHYSRVAMEKVRLPREARHLAWLDLSSQEGHEYWIAMNLAGHYASANHHEIHSKIARGLGIDPLVKIENHHNFAWRENLSDGRPVVVHRKGATPAGKGEIGVIPGSMTHPGFVVKGKGQALSINSASHGAGRSMSRSQALKKFNWDDLQKVIRDKGVELIGGDIDEIPMAYKSIDTVMNHQHDLVEILATFQPRIVRMADADRRRRR